MLKYNTDHIFCGYLKQLLSTKNIPTCKILTPELMEAQKTKDKKDLKLLESFSNIVYRDSESSGSLTRAAVEINYLIGTDVCYYQLDTLNIIKDSSKEIPTYTVEQKGNWIKSDYHFYNEDRPIPGITKTLKSSGPVYDSSTHEYLGDYLRYLRDYKNVNLMSLYNCFTNKIYNNINFTLNISEDDTKENKQKIIFSSQDTHYRIYGIPVKLFENYTIAIDSNQGIELFCGFYSNALDITGKAADLIKKTYQKINETHFSQPIVYSALDKDNWTFAKSFEAVKNPELTKDSTKAEYVPAIFDADTITRWDIAIREEELKLFIKVPANTRSSIVILEGDYRTYNDAILMEKQTGQGYLYKQNHTVINFGNEANPNQGTLKPISKLQLLSFNTGESYPFADRLIEYLSGSAITPAEPLPDNIKRVQKVMNQNNHYFSILGLWENKMQKIIYDHIINSGPVIYKDGKIKDLRKGYYKRLGHSCKSTTYDILGYIDRDAEKWYASWSKTGIMQNNILNVDIYDGLYDLENK